MLIERITFENSVFKVDHNTAKLHQLASSNMYCELFKHMNAQVFINANFTAPLNYALWQSFQIPIACTFAKKQNKMYLMMTKCIVF